MASVWPVWFSLPALAQETVYSADSLMAAFKKGSQISLKGTEITFTGAIAEIKNSRVTFKSSGNDKVICELVLSIENGNEELLVGSPLTVVGKVRGRGMLGNVTLDECNLASSEPSHAGPEEPQQSLQATEVEVTAPVADAVSTKRLSPKRTVQARTPAARAVPGGSAQPNEEIREGSNFTGADFPGVRGAFVAVLVGLGALVAFLKLRPAIASGLRSSPNAPTEEMRRAALEALLSGQKKKKWRRRNSG
jgi:hypothetical protein